MKEIIRLYVLKVMRPRGCIRGIKLPLGYLLCHPKAVNYRLLTLQDIAISPSRLAGAGGNGRQQTAALELFLEAGVQFRLGRSGLLLCDHLTS